MHPSIACKILGLSMEEAKRIGPEMVRSKAAGLFALAHPDSNGGEAADPDALARIKLARDTLVRHLQAGLDGDETPCDVCGGKGRVRGDGWKQHDCPKCKGTGAVKL